MLRLNFYLLVVFIIENIRNALNYKTEQLADITFYPTCKQVLPSNCPDILVETQ